MARLHGLAGGDVRTNLGSAMGRQPKLPLDGRTPITEGIVTAWPRRQSWRLGKPRERAARRARSGVSAGRAKTSLSYRGGCTLCQRRAGLVGHGDRFKMATQFNGSGCQVVFACARATIVLDWDAPPALPPLSLEAGRGSSSALQPRFGSSGTVCG